MQPQKPHSQPTSPSPAKGLTAEALAEHLSCGSPSCDCPKEQGDGWMTHCPSHADATPSLHISQNEDGKVLLYCHAGCSQEDVLEALRERGVWPNGPTQSESGRKMITSYDYVDESGHLLYQAVRFEPKDFRQRRPDGQGGWIYKVKGTRLVPYQLPLVIESEEVVIVEGEKDCDNLFAAGLTATCNVMGAGKWREQYNVFFQGKQVVILPDNDEPGRQHAQQVAQNLWGIAASLKVLELPGLPEKGDVSDWLAAGGSAEELRRLAEAAPGWEPSERTQPKSFKAKPARASKPNQPDLHVVSPDEVAKPRFVKAALPDAPVSDDLIEPDGYELHPDSLNTRLPGQDGVELMQIAPAPLVIAGRLINQIDGTEKIRLAWPRDGGWKQHIVAREVIATSRSITQLAGVGLPVTSGNARNLVQYLADFEAVNIEVLPRTRVSPHLGWQGEDGKLGFLWGRTLLTPGREPTAIDLEGPLQPCYRDLVTFQGADAGEEQLADAFHSRGSLADWVRAMQQVAQFPRVILCVYAALAPPLLDNLGCPNFIFDLCGPTSGGKTTAARAAGSCWGNPDERHPASVVGSWDATPVWINSASTVLHSLPLILDDTKRAKNPKDIGRILYNVASGRDRGRGSKIGLRRSGTWRTILLSTGEAPATSFTTDGGTRGRVLTLWGHPFGKADQTTVQVVRELNSAVLRNYGHAGPLFVQFLLARQFDREKWLVKYHQVVEGYQKKAGADPVAGRLCHYFGLLDLAAGIAHAALDLPWSYRDPVEALWDDLVAGATEGDVAMQALVTVVNWAKANQGCFQGRQPDRDRVPPQGWAGRWETGAWEFIAFAPQRLMELLQGFNFEPAAVIRAWQDRGWLIGGGNRKKKQVRIDGEPMYTWALSRAAVEEADNQG